MTIPWQMNCGHSADGWCLACVKKLQKQVEELTELVDGMDAELVRVRTNHSKLARGIKKVLGYEHWPELDKPFQEAAIELLEKYIKSLLRQIPGGKKRK